MRALEFIAEAKVPSVRDQIRADVRKHGGYEDEYFVRFTDADKLGYSAKQTFGRTPDMDDPKFSIDYIGRYDDKRGHPALWFYPLKFWLKNPSTYAADKPYAWLVKLKPDAWLQDARLLSRGIKAAPAGRQRVGIFRHSMTPAAIFFRPGFDVIGRYYDYAGQHQRHGEVKGAPEPSFFDRVRGDA